MSVQKLAFVDEVTGLGQYRPRAGSNFKENDTCTVYAEVTGFSMPPVAGSDGEYSLSLNAGFAIKNPYGQELAFVPDMVVLDSKAYMQFPVHFLSFSFPMSGWPDGDFVLEVSVMDNLSGRGASRDLSLHVEPPRGGPAPQEIYETTGTFLNLESTGGGWVISLLVGGQRASAPTAANCQYYVYDSRVTRETFAERAAGSQVTVEFHGDSSEVSVCRVQFN